MAGFTSIGLMLGGALLNKALNRGKKQDEPQTQQPLAPGPTTATPNALAPPAPPILNPADANAQALAAGQKARKRAAQGSLLGGAKVPTSNTMPVAPRYAQRTLLGS